MCELGSESERRLEKTARVEIQNWLRFKRVYFNTPSVGGVMWGSDTSTSMEHNWDDTDGGKWKYFNQDLPQ